MHQLAPQPTRERAAQDTPKSRRTRNRILDAAMRMTVEVGYHEATNACISEAAGITRGAMLYHFPTREDLVGATIAHIQRQRMARLKEVGLERPAGADPADHAIDAYWSLLSVPAFVAFAELEAVARTDRMVRQALAPAQAEFDRAHIGEGPIAATGAAAARLQAGRDFARFLLEGLSRARLTYETDERTERLLAVIKRATHRLNRKGAETELWPE
jgi:AcrR family transcriptional regulator